MYERLRGLFHHSAAYTLGSLLNRAFAFIIIPIYTRALTQQDYGAYVLLNAGAAVLTVVYELGISSAVTRYYYEFDDDAARRRYIGTAWVTLTGITAALTALLLVFGAGISQPLFRGISFWPYVVLMIATTFLSTAAYIPYVLMRVREQSTRFVVVIVAQAVILTVLVIVLVVVLHLGLLGAVLALFGESVAVFVFFTAYTLRNASLRFEWSWAKRSLVYGAPVMLLLGGWWVLDAADRFILRHFTTARVVAIYSVGYAIGRILVLVSQSANQALTPFFFSLVKEGDPETDRILSYTATYFTLAVAGLGLLIVVFAREAVLFFGGYAYLEAAKVTPLIVVAAVIQGMFYVPSRGLFLKSKTAYLPPLVAAGAGVNIALNFWLIPAYGMIGAAVATIAGYVVTVALTYVVSQRSYRIHYQTARMAKLLGVFCVVTALSMAVQPHAWYLLVLSKFALLAAAPALLFLLGFFERQELAAVRRMARRPRFAGGSAL